MLVQKAGQKPEKPQNSGEGAQLVFDDFPWVRPDQSVLKWPAEHKNFTITSVT